MTVLFINTFEIAIVSIGGFVTYYSYKNFKKVMLNKS